MHFLVVCFPHQWYNTPDKVNLGEDGFLWLLDSEETVHHGGGGMATGAALSTEASNQDKLIIVHRLPDTSQ